MYVTDEELAALYVEYKHRKKLYKERQSLYDLNKYLESKKGLSIIKMEMKRRGLKKKDAKQLSGY